MVYTFRRYASTLVLLALLITPYYVSAQNRLSDDDLEKLMGNLKEDSRQFRSNFDSEIGKSPIRKTAQEKQSKDLVEQFQKQTEDLLKKFKDNRHADAELKATRDSADQIDRTLTSTPLGGNVTSSWSRVKTELGSISKAFGVETSTPDQSSTK